MIARSLACDCAWQAESPLRGGQFSLAPSQVLAGGRIGPSPSKDLEWKTDAEEGLASAHVFICLLAPTAPTTLAFLFLDHGISHFRALVLVLSSALSLLPPYSFSALLFFFFVVSLELSLPQKHFLTTLSKTAPYIILSPHPVFFSFS